MNARPSKPPVSRRQLREEAAVGSDEAAPTGTDDEQSAGSEETAAVAPVISAGGRRVRWNPAGSPTPAADDPATGDSSVAADAVQDTAASDGSPDAATGDPAVGAPPFRKREYRQEGRRSSFAPAFVVAENAGADGPSVNAPHSPADAVPDDGTSGSDGSATDSGSHDDIDLAAPERTMTRRELRILRARAEAAGLPAPDVMFLPNGESTVTGAIPVLDGVAFQSALVPDVDAAGVVTEERIPDRVESGSETATPPPVDESASESPQVIPALVEPDPAWSARLPSDATGSDAPAEIVVEAEPATGDHPVAEAAMTPVEQPDPVTDDGTDPSASPAPGRLRPFDAMFLPPSARVDDDDVVDRSADEAADPLPDTSSAQPVNDTDGLRGDILAAPAAAARPFGHWSTQEGEDDATGESTLSRDVGTGVVTTHALVLPSIPDAGEPLLSPLTSTGEVMVTGIVELPKSYGSTGAHPALFDHPEVDSLIDDTDREDAESGAAPVRATRAVSSTTTTRSMVETAPTKRSRVLPIVAIIVGGVVLVAAASWAIAAIFFNAF